MRRQLRRLLSTLLLVVILATVMASTAIAATAAVAALSGPNSDASTATDSSSSTVSDSSSPGAAATSSPTTSGPNAELPDTTSSSNNSATSLGSSTSSQCAALRTGTLSLTCNGACAAYSPCLATGASVLPSTSATKAKAALANSSCAYECFEVDAARPQSYAQFVFLVPFGGSWSNPLELAAGAVLAESSNATNDTASFPSESNALLQRIDALVLPRETSSVKIVGGSSTASSSLKARVVNVELSPQLVSNQSQLSSVALVNLRLEPATDTLSGMLPSQLQTLVLNNGLLTRFPSGLDKVKTLQTLYLNRNFIATVNASSGLSSLSALYLSQNQLTHFDAYFPNLTTLHLGGNNLSAIPSAVFKHKNLRELVISANKFSNLTVTKAEATFLASLTAFAFDETSLFKGCASSERVAVHSVDFCVSEASNSNETSDGESDSGPSAAVLVVIVCVTVLLLVGIVLVYRAQTARLGVRSDSDEDVEANGSSDTASGASTVPTSESKKRGSMNSLSNSRDATAAVSDSASGSSKSKSKSRTSAAKMMNPFKMMESASSGGLSVWDDPELLELQVDVDAIEDMRRIGDGAFGEVWLVAYSGGARGKHRADNGVQQHHQVRLLASKRIKQALRDNELNRERTQAFIGEIKLVAQLHHPKIVAFVGAAWTIESDLQALFEYMDGGDLREYLESESTPREWSAEKVRIAADIIEGLMYVHSFITPLVHRDLKSRNVLLDAARSTAKLTDFGVSRYRSVAETMTAGVGTGRWLAPEVITGEGDYGPAADIFSFGVVLSELDTHELPYAAETASGELVEMALLQLVASGELRPRLSASCPPEIAALATQCLSLNPADRPPAPALAYEFRLMKQRMGK